MESFAYPLGWIELEEMLFYAYHGCFKEEQIVGNRFAVNVSYAVDCSLPSASDHLHDAVNYVEVFQIVKQEMEIKSHLLEHVTSRIFNHLSQSFPNIVHLAVKVSKLNPPVGGQMKGISVTFRK